MTAHAAISIDKVMRSKLLLGNYFSGPSWDRWESLSQGRARHQAERDRTCHVHRGGRSVATDQAGDESSSPPQGEALEKTASYHWTQRTRQSRLTRKGKLRPGEYAYVMCIACDRDQAGILFNFIRGYFDEVPALKKMVRDVSADTITLTNRVIIEVTNKLVPRRSRPLDLARDLSTRSPTSAATTQANPDFELHGALTPGLARVPGSMMVLISSAHKRSGLLYERYKTYYGKDDDDVLVVKGGTRQFNPKFDQSEIDKALASDPQLYAAEYLSEWRDDLSAFIPRTGGGRN